MASSAGTGGHVLSAARFLLATILTLALTAGSPAAAAVGFELHHRFSDRVREWAEERRGAVDHQVARWPDKRSVEYYSALAHHDSALRGRFLAGAGANSSVDELLAFAARGNITFQIPSMGFLYYAFVELGTPKEEFLVALDTGSALFWVPCDCLQCAPTNDMNFYGVNITYNIYSPSNSSTSQRILCSDAICSASCTGSNTTSCPYQVAYADGGTTSGVLVEDILHLTTQDSTPQHTIQKPVILGCGRNQTGSLLQGGGANGLLGLARSKIAVPSILASDGLVSDSFSMCFGGDGTGRLDFGDKGSSQQEETPLISSKQFGGLYVITITGMVIGNSSIAESFNAIVDTGTSFTYLTDPMYTSLAESFDSQVSEKRRLINNSDLPFEYCYDLSPTQTYFLLPKTSFTTMGGGKYPINEIVIQVYLQGDSSPSAYCLAVIRSHDGFNIIGENFMSGLRLVFDREKLVLGWENFDCYNKTSSTSASSLSESPAAPPAMSPAESGRNPPPQIGSGSSNLDVLTSKLALMVSLLSLAFL
ncbi:aspartyl protease family protein 1-like [Canna indica]|uniref:Aspartyl protease family protein 1-like n=1 Tax=Canna indica TaxID=4628 RepID=A0AAQ3L5E3_9LILI|nr:aspartyl protease family protein 1-like [Canna indica]